MKSILFILITLIHAQVATAKDNPLELLQTSSVKNQWIVYKVPAQDDTRSMCCWNQKWKSIKVNGQDNFDFKSCDLSSKSQGYGTSKNSPITENLNIFVKIKHGKVNRILTLGDSCEIKNSGQKIKWINNINESKSIEFLRRVTETGKFQKNTVHDALFAMSHHKSNKASKQLYKIALKNKKGTSNNAVFWLGEARNDGVKYLKKLFQELPHGDLRHHINFALSQAKNEEAINMLKSIAKNDTDTEQRSDAIFWLSQSDVEDIVPILLKAVETDDSSEVQEKAIFSLAQVETDVASDALIKLAQTHQRKNIREQALFWLVEVDSIKAKQIVLTILKNNLNNDEMEHAVFTLSRIDEESGDEGLFEVLQGDYSKSIKKKALFWLVQSDNENTIARLQALL